MTARPTRRGLLGAAAASSAGAVAAAFTVTSAAADDRNAGPTPPASFPFEGPHQAGILEPRQQAAVFVSFTVTSDDRDRLQQALRTLTSTIRYLTSGRDVPYDGMASTAYENGVL
ncbi:MAG: Dyp-type peroxidase, partial [Actinomycetia bacterium]|nr:Dyp-type peroxidase [Actinomycetes bacterium]